MIPGAFEVRRAASAPNSPGGGTTEAPHPPVVPDSARPEKDLAGEPPSPATTSWLQRKFRALVSGSG